MMTMFRKRATWLLAAVLLVPAVTLAAAPKWSGMTIGEVYEEIRDYSENKQRLAEAEERLVDMQVDLDVVKNRMTRKESVLDLIDSGHLSLTAAGEAFLVLDRENEPSYALEYRPGSLAECAQARVIKFLKIRHHDTTNQRQFTPLIQQLEKEFESRFGYPPPRE